MAVLEKVWILIIVDMAGRLSTRWILEKHK
jgi:hypothetical protein